MSEAAHCNRTNRGPVHWRAAVGIVAIALLAGCQDNCFGGHPHIAGVLVVPAEIYAEHQVPFQLEAWAIDDQGRRRAYSGPVNWTIPSGLAVTGSTTANPITLVGTLPGASNFSTLTPIRAKIESKTSQPATATISRAGVNRDQVILNSMSNPAPAVVMFDAAAGANCPAHFTVAMVRRAALPDNLIPGCSPLYLVFSVDHSLRHTLGTVIHPWTTLPTDQLIIDAPPPPITVPLVFYWATGGPLELVKIQGHVSNATNTMRRSRAGLRFDAPAAAQIQIATQPVSLTSLSCSDAAVALANDGYDLTVKTLYVVYFASITNAKAFSCGPEGGRDAGIIALSNPNVSDVTMVHELGHMMGLLKPDDTQGHTADGGKIIEGFDWSNLMWAWQTTNESVYRIRLSLGQAYRVNLENNSWIVHAGLRPSIPVDCDCDPYDTSLCPKLSADITPTPPGTTWPTC